MACSTCKKSKVYLSYSPLLKLSSSSCKYSFNQLVNKYDEIKDSKRELDIFYLKSAINFYSKDCNKFNNYLDSIL